MTRDLRFMTYTQMEKALRRILARYMPARQKTRTLQTQYRKILDAVDVSAWIGKVPSDSLTPLRLITTVGHAKARPLRHHSHAHERITA